MGFHIFHIFVLICKLANCILLICVFFMKMTPYWQYLTYTISKHKTNEVFMHFNITCHSNVYILIIFSDYNKLNFITTKGVAEVKEVFPWSRYSSGNQRMALWQKIGSRGICVIKAGNIHRLKAIVVQIMKWHVANFSHGGMTLNGKVKGKIFTNCEISP